MRRTREVTISDAASRDDGKTFVLTEMDADRSERWAIRATLALMRSGLSIPDELATGGLAVIATVGLQAFVGLSYDELAPLLSEMMDCVQIKEQAATRKLTPDDIEEVGTRFKLRSEVLDLHLGFSLRAKVSELTSALQAALAEAASPSNAETSPDPLPLSSEAA